MKMKLSWDGGVLGEGRESCDTKLRRFASRKDPVTHSVTPLIVSLCSTKTETKPI